MLERALSNGELLVGMQNSAAILDESLALSYKTKHTPILQTSKHALWCLPKGVESLCPHKICSQMFVAALFIIAQT